MEQSLMLINNRYLMNLYLIGLKIKQIINVNLFLVK
jgi:hypothetical protein